jgi:hypothetical protein
MQMVGIRSTLDQLVDLRKKLNALGAEKWNRADGTSRPILGVETAGAPTRYAQAVGRHWGMSLANPGDQDIAALNKLMGEVITEQGQTVAALMKQSGTRNYQFAKDVKGHLPDPKGDFQTNMDNLDFLLSPKGPYQTWLKEAGVTPTDIPPLASPSATPTPGAGGGGGAGGMGYDDWKKKYDY